MRKNFLYVLTILGLVVSLSSCRSAAPRLDYKALARASVRLGVDIINCISKQPNGWVSLIGQVVNPNEALIVRD